MHAPDGYIGVTESVVAAEVVAEAAAAAAE